MQTRQLRSTPGFVVTDLADAQNYVGPTRLGTRLVPDKAVMLARHVTYVFATLEQRRSGATIGLKSDPEQAAQAVDALAQELADEFSSGLFATSAGLRLDDDLLAPVLAYETRNRIGSEARNGLSFADELIGVGAAHAAAGLLGGLDGRSIAIEGFGPAGLAIARECEAHGAQIRRVATADGCSTAAVDAATLSDAWTSDGSACVAALSPDRKAAKPWQVYRDDTDVIFCGSKPGAMSGDGATAAGGTAVVGFGEAAISSKALAVLRSAGAPVAADFVAGLGPALSWWRPADTTRDEMRASVAETVDGIMAETVNHPDGAFMAACYRAEAFMAGWQPELPFGRPLG